MAAVRMSFSYPEEMKESLVLLADTDKRTLSQYIQLILNEHIEQNQRGVTKKRKEAENQENTNTQKTIKRKIRKRK